MNRDWKARYESVQNEPHLQPGRSFAADPAEATPPPIPTARSSREQARDSVASEPALHGDDAHGRFAQWLGENRARTRWPASLGAILLAGLAGGFFAVFGAFAVMFVVPPSGMFGIATMVIFVPVAEELLKQSGMIYLLEFKPYLVRGFWQIFLSSLLAALIFATIENLLYTNFYVRPGDVKDFAFFVQFRWVVCTSLHVVCVAISSLGLGLVWRRVMEEGRPADLQAAYPFFFGAMVLHGLYNLSAYVAESVFSLF